MTETAEDRAVGPWEPRTLEDGAGVEVRLGPLTLHLARRGDEIHTAHRRPEPHADGTPDGAAEGEPDWSRWATRGWSGRIVLTPSFPDRPIVVAPEDPFHLLAGADARIYVRAPLWVKIEIPGEGRDRTLETLPTIPYSDTWWGTLAEGELCYWLTTHARRHVSDDLFQPHLAMCPIQLVNRSEHDLIVDKIALRVDYLGLYAAEDRIWSDETRVRYQGDAEGSRLEVAGSAPTEAPDARLLAAPRLEMARGFRARTFARIRGMGMHGMHGWMT